MLYWEKPTKTEEIPMKHTFPGAGRCLRALAVLLAFLALTPLLPRAAAAGWEETFHAERVLPALKDYFMGTEGDYASVNPNDNGALSVGILQWHGVRALKLVQRTAAAFPETAALLTAQLRTEIRDPGTTWKTRTLNSTEKAALSAFLSTAAGVQTQDAQARDDLSDYLRIAYQAGMRSDATAFYYASICNQFGNGGAKTYLSCIRETMGVDSTYCFRSLDELHAAAHATQSYGQRYLPTRDRTYARIRDLGWSLTGQDRFLDLPPAGSWARPGIDYVLEKGLFQGVSETAFAPELEMSRAMAVTVLWRAAGEPESGEPTAFADVRAGAWYAAPVAWAAGAGIVNGRSPYRFDPAEPVTREELAAFLYRSAERLGPEAGGSLPEDPNQTLSAFSDGSKVSSYARPAVAWAVEQGILRGLEGDGGLYLEPRRPVTRAETAVLMMRFCSSVKP